MKLLVIADLHLDDYPSDAAREPLAAAIRTAARHADALIIAGDLTESGIAHWEAALNWLAAICPPEKIHVVPGNHDYYGGNLDTADIDLELACEAVGFGFGQCQALVLGDTRVLMTTLWTDMRLFAEEFGEEGVRQSLWRARQMMPDYGYRSIVVGWPERPLRPLHTVAVHERQRAWLETELARPWSGKTIVITHHAPSATVAGGITSLSPCFASNLDDLIDRFRPIAWLFGHTHRPAETRAPGGTLLRNISLGYEFELTPPQMRMRVRSGLIDLENLG